MRIELFDARPLTPLVHFLDRNGIASQPLLDRARIPGELLSIGGWVSKKQAYDFTFECVQRAQSPAVVYAAYESDFHFEHMGPIADAMQFCKTVKESLELGARLGSIAYEGSEYFLTSDRETTWFCFRDRNIVSAGHTYIHDMTLGAYCHLIREFADPEWFPKRMLTQGEVVNRHTVVGRFQDCEARFHPDYSALGFPTEFLSRRLPKQEHAVDFDEAEAWQFGPDGSAPIVDILYRLLASRFRFRNLPTLDSVALMVGVSPATLKRKLYSAGLSYRNVLDRLRFDEACEMLAIPQVSEREIAHELGYSGTNNFVRSFRRMTGMTPGQYRRRETIAAP